MEDFVMTLLVCSATMSALALAYMAATPLLARRYSVKSRYYAWLVLVIGLIIPFRPRLGAPIVRLDPPAGMAAPVMDLGGGIPASAGPALSAAAPAAAWWQLAAAVWLAGMLAVLACHAVKHCRFLRLTGRWSRPVTDGRGAALLQSLKAEMGISREIGLLACDCIGSPMLIGLARPRILLPGTDFAQEDLRFILKHELIHYRRRDLWYKGLLLIATAVHWFNPVICLMAKAVDAQCEQSCDEAVVRSTDADTRQSYSEAIIGVVRYKSKLKTALSTHFYGGKQGMKTRIFSIMDMSKKRAGGAVLCGMLLLTLGTGIALPAKAQAQNPSQLTGGDAALTAVTPWISVAMIPDPGAYARYAPFGISISEDGTKLLCNGQPVRLFVDGGTEAFYLDGAGQVNLSAVRNADGALTGVEEISAEKAQEYYDAFFAEELSGAAPMAAENVIARDTAQVGPDKYGQYQPFGITYSTADEGLYYNGQRVKCFVDRVADGWFYTLWTDDAGTVNLAAVRDASGQLTGVERISEEQAREYRDAAAAQGENVPAGLEDRVAAGIAARFGQD